MTIILDGTGLTIDTLLALNTTLQTGYKAIYGADLNFDSNTPDGQALGLFAQQAIDVEELLNDIYTGFDPDNCVGVQQDRLYYLNGLRRQPATYSYLTVNITVNQSLTLQGLDTNINSATATGYTVTDNLGNNWILADTQTPSTSGTYPYNFRAQNLGAVNSAANSVTLPVSVVLGVTAINNPTSASTLGINGEPDPAFRLRRAQSFALQAYGSADALYSQLANLTGVTSVTVYRNNTGSTDSNGVPAHSIWVIIEGGADASIAQLIYVNAGYGGMKGSSSYNITTVQGQIFTAYYDRPTSQPLYMKFNLKSTLAGQTFNISGIQNYISNNQSYAIGAFAETSSLTYQAMMAITSTGAKAIPLDVFVSIDGSTWTDYVVPTGPNYQFVLSASNITITTI